VKLERRVALGGTALGITVIGGCFAAIVFVKARELHDVLPKLQAQLTKLEAKVTVSASTKSLFASTYKDLRVDFGTEVSVVTRQAQARRTFFAPPSVYLEEATYILRGKPDALWRQWLGMTRLGELPIHIDNASVDYQDRAIGNVALTNATFQQQNESLRVRATQLTFNGKRFSDVSLAVSRPQTVVSIGLGNGTAELSYVPRAEYAAEWMLSIPSQPLYPLLEKLGSKPTTVNDTARITGTASVIVFDDASKPLRGSMRLVIDNWFVPPWPEARAITGNTGAIGIHMESTGDGSTWKLSRVETNAAVFSLVGTGILSFGEPSRLSFTVSGTRNCAQLAEHLPPSTYRETVKTYLERDKSFRDKVPDTTTNNAPTAIENRTVELRLNVDMTIGTGGQTRFLWHVAEGCGLRELDGEGSLGGNTRQ
jgi:hypothetical protein